MENFPYNGIKSSSCIVFYSGNLSVWFVLIEKQMQTKIRIHPLKWIESKLSIHLSVKNHTLDPSINVESRARFVCYHVCIYDLEYYSCFPKKIVLKSIKLNSILCNDINLISIYSCGLADTFEILSLIFYSVVENSIFATYGQKLIENHVLSLFLRAMQYIHKINIYSSNVIFGVLCYIVYVAVVCSIFIYLQIVAVLFAPCFYSVYWCILWQQSCYKPCSTFSNAGWNGKSK